MSVCGSSLAKRAPLDGLLAKEAGARPLQVPVGLVGPEGLRVEDDEPRIDAAAAERLHVRPADPGQVDRAMGDSQRQLRVGEEKADAVPAGDLAAVRAGEAGVHRLASERALDVGDLRAAVDLGAGDALRDRRERIVELARGGCRPARGCGSVPRRRAGERPDLRRRVLVAACEDRDLAGEVVGARP